MKRIQTVLFTLGFTLIHPLAASEESYTAPLATQSLLLDITKTENSWFVVGERGHILSSQNGKDWTQATVPTLSTLTAIDAQNGKLWAVGHDAIILFKQNQQSDWQIQMFNPELQKPHMDVLFFDEQHGIVVGAYGSFYRTRDGGQTWNKELHAELLDPDDRIYLEEIRLEDEEFYFLEMESILPHLNRLMLDDGKVYLAGEAGLLAVSEDNGQSWERMDVDYNGSFFDVSTLSDGRILAAGLRGNLFEFLPQQQQWQELQTGVEASLNSLVVLGDNSYVAVGNGGTLVCSNNGQLTKAQVDDGKSIVNALLKDGLLIAVTGGGIKTFDISQQNNLCEGQVVSYE